eukprot:TRINITY_DN19897_c0_g1_i7.p1 TRINITY_DN19897_c0_g1~~TRINITY_DN19897_c0_g1_i7.p1  ORF type:complete len:143 (-),score=19.98 TRINITY_DN19897_c0_g1_i7:35-463(-)
MGISGLCFSHNTFLAFHSAFCTPTNSSSWFIDSGASNHMTFVEQSLQGTQPYVGNDTITTTNGHQLSIYGIGFLQFSKSSDKSLVLNNVYFVPQLSANLISVGQLVDSGYLVNFSPTGCVIQEQQTGKVIRAWQAVSSGHRM